MPEPYFIVGPTAVGKTALAVRVAELCGAEIVSADAFQVYAGLDRLTAKPAAAELARVPHHLIGHVPLAENYSVARYHAEASACLRDIAARSRPAIVVGGSGLYVKALTHGLSPLPPAHPDLRAQLEADDLAALGTRLVGLDPTAAATIDLKNKRRVVRALEVCLVTGRPFSDQQTAWESRRSPICGTFLQRTREDLLGRIVRRVGTLLDDAALDEARTASLEGLSDTSARIIGLVETRAFLAGRLGRVDFLEQVAIATRRYAKRQLTWFRGETFTDVAAISQNTDFDELASTIAVNVTVSDSGRTSSDGDKPAQT